LIIIYFFTTAQANNIAKINPRLEAALKERASLRDDQPKPVADPEPKKPEAPVNAGLKGVSQSLIDKVIIDILFV